MIQVCAYCWEVIGANLKVKCDSEHPLSHGGCVPCLCKEMKEFGLPEKEIEEFRKEHNERIENGHRGA